LVVEDEDLVAVVEEEVVVLGLGKLHLVVPMEGQAVDDQNQTRLA
jgi:hypothetical protein